MSFSVWRLASIKKGSSTPRPWLLRAQSIFSLSPFLFWLIYSSASWVSGSISQLDASLTVILASQNLTQARKMSKKRLLKCSVDNTRQVRHSAAKFYYRSRGFSSTCKCEQRKASKCVPSSSLSTAIRQFSSEGECSLNKRRSLFLYEKDKKKEKAKISLPGARSIRRHARGAERCRLRSAQLRLKVSIYREW